MKPLRTFPLLIHRKISALPVLLIAALFFAYASLGFSEENKKNQKPAAREQQITEWIEQLKSEDWEVRESAMKQLRDSGKAALPLLNKYKQTNDYDLQSRISLLIKWARFHLSEDLPKDLVQKLLSYPQLGESGKEVVVRDLISNGSPGSLQILTQILETENSGKLQELIWDFLGTTPAHKENLDSLLLAYDQCSEALKGKALWALANVPNAETQKRIQQALNSESQTLKSWGVRCIARINDESSLAHIRKLLEKPEALSEDLHIACLGVLSDMVDRKSIPIFLKHINHPTRRIRNACLSGLGIIANRQNNAQVREELEKLYRETKDEEHQEKILATMGNICDPAFNDTLIGALNSSNPLVLVTVIQTLGNLRVQKAAPEIMKHLDSEDPELRMVAAEVLGNLAYKPAVQKIKDSSKGLVAGNRFEYTFAVALANMGDSDGIFKLKTIATRSTGRDYADAMYKLGGWGHPEALPLLDTLTQKGNTFAANALMYHSNNRNAFEFNIKDSMRDYLLATNDRYKANARLQATSLFNTRGMFPMAIQFFREAEKEGSSNTGYSTNLAHAFHENGQLKEANEIYDRLENTEGTGTEFLNSRAWLYATSYKSEFLRPKAALALVQKAIAKSPHSSHITDTLGWSYHVNGKYKDAIRELKKALALREPGDIAGRAWERTRLARSLWADGQKEAALKEIEIATQTAPHRADVWFESAGFFSTIGKRDEAIHAMHKSIDQGLLNFNALKLNPEFNSLKKDPGYLYAIQRAEKEYAKLAKEIKHWEREVRLKLRSSGKASANSPQNQLIEILRSSK